MGFELLDVLVWDEMGAREVLVLLSRVCEIYAEINSSMLTRFLSIEVVKRPPAIERAFKMFLNFGY